MVDKGKRWHGQLGISAWPCLVGGHTMAWPLIQDAYSTVAHLRRCPSYISWETCTLVTTVAWQMAVDYLEERAPNSNSHKDTHCMGWQGEALRVSPGVSVPFSCGALDECGPVVSLGPLDPEPAPFNPYIKAQWSSLCRQLPNPYILHPVGQSATETISRSILIKSVTVTGTLCLWLNARTSWEPTVPFGLLG